MGIDADTIIHPGAISLTGTTFPESAGGGAGRQREGGQPCELVDAVAGAGIHHQPNFERRALNVWRRDGGAGSDRSVENIGGARCRGVSLDTVAEDADLTMALLARGYRVEYEDRALAFTEAPTNANGLMRQRFRWSFGILQSVWKHRGGFEERWRTGLDRAAKHCDLSDPAAAGVTIHRPDVRVRL